MGCGFHKNFELICVIDLAGSYEDFFEQLLQFKQGGAGNTRRDKENRDTSNLRNGFYGSSPKKQVLGERGNNNSNGR